MFAFRIVPLALLLAAATAGAHYHMLLPDRSSVKTDEEVGFTYRFGHPFEHELFDTAKPEAVYVVAPDGTKTDLTDSLTAFTTDGAGGKKVTGYKFTFTPPKRGDYTFVAVSPAVNVEGEKLPLKDVAKVILHVQTQNGWDQRVLEAKTAPIEVAPLTRPYGLLPGMGYSFEVESTEGGADRKAMVGCKVEIEKYNRVAPPNLPADEFVTFTARTTKAGSAAVTFIDAGWWGITAVHPDERVQHRSTLWVYVEPVAK